jgi:hypothetical protein
MSPGVSTNCSLFAPCLDPALPWDGSIAGTPGAFTATINLCLDFFLGTFSGPTTGEWRSASGSTPPQIEFDSAPIGDSGATLDGIFNISRTTLSVS